MNEPSVPLSASLNRRQLLAAAGAAAAASTWLQTDPATAAEPVVKRGRIQQTVCAWCYSSLSLDELCVAAKQIGLPGIDLVRPAQFPILKKHGLVCSMTPTHPITDGLNDPANHESCLKAIHEAIEATAAEGWKNVICFSGNRRGMDDRTGLKNCAHALRQIVPVAEEKGIVIQMELLNSRVNHKDYMCDRSAWGIELVKQVGSDHFRLLYDIYHMQIMEGDIIRSIQQNHQYFGHYHTAGNPGRHELDDNQELNYPAIVRAIVDSGYTGFLGQEFIPQRDPLTSLAEAVALCDV